MDNKEFFKQNGYVYVKGFISKDVAEILKNAFIIERNAVSHVENKTDKNAYGDEQIPQSYSSYASYGFESLMYTSTQKVQDNTGLVLYPTYSYARIYYKDSELLPHTDRESCEISASVCVDKTTKYPFLLRNRNGDTVSIDMEIGDAVIYSGCELTHWRNKYEGNGHIQTFIHYVDANGKNKDFAYDQRPNFGLKRID